MADCLILSCSQTKRLEAGPAYEVYNGPYYRILRKYGPPWPVDIYVLSAKHGLIPVTHSIEPYDQKLLPADEMFWRTSFWKSMLIPQWLNMPKYEWITACAGATYMSWLDRLPLNKGQRLEGITGGIGMKCSSLKWWLGKWERDRMHKDRNWREKWTSNKSSNG